MNKGARDDPGASSYDRRGSLEPQPGAARTTSLSKPVKCVNRLPAADRNARLLAGENPDSRWGIRGVPQVLGPWSDEP